MVKILVCASRGNTMIENKLPEEENESNCDDKVIESLIARLKTYKDVEVLYINHSMTNEVEKPEHIINQINIWSPDVYVSIHHNAIYENHGIHSNPDSNQKEDPVVTLRLIDDLTTGYPRIINAQEKSDPDIKQNNFHVLRKTVKSLIIVEGVFMNSVVDIIKLCHEDCLRAEGEAIADGLAKYIKLELKSEIVSNKTHNDECPQKKSSLIDKDIIEASTHILEYLESDSEGVIPVEWQERIKEGTLTDSDAICLLYVVIHRWLSKDIDS